MEIIINGRNTDIFFLMLHTQLCQICSTKLLCRLKHWLKEIISEGMVYTYPLLCTHIVLSTTSGNHV